MAVGRILTQGLGSFSEAKYLPTLGYGDFDAVVAVVTNRVTLVGASRERFNLTGTSQQRHSLVGTSQQRQDLIGN